METKEEDVKASSMEAQMREETAPTVDTIEELGAYIAQLLEREHDYGTCVYAVSLAAVAAYNLVARKLGVTGFQASCADLDILRRTRHLDCPFMLVTGDKELLPQYDNLQDVKAWQKEIAPWVTEQARKKIETNLDAHPDVLAHWRALANRTQTEAAEHYL